MDNGEVEPAAWPNRLRIAPQPETKTALLKSEHFDTGWTRHEYVRTELVQMKSKREGKEVTTPAWSHIFKCTQTGVERRWGLEAA